jgi:signal transduction histidine kinase
LSPLELEDRERTIAQWLAQHGATPTLAEPLAETGMTLEMLASIAKHLQGAMLDRSLEWIAADVSTRRLISEIQTASLRVHSLVAAAKEYTQMDRAAVPEQVDIRQGIESAAAILRSKVRMKSAGLTLTFVPNLPFVYGFGSELNQVWSNLIDNALDAVGDQGRVEVSAASEGKVAVVRVVDNGPGIPPDIRDRIFEPFFTTKDVGAGTGLGLDIVRRVVQQHNGHIDVDSRPGRTEFKVCLPITGINPQAARP